MPLKQSGFKVIALDFDGTLVESNHIKDHAFETIFSDWPEQNEAMMAWHSKHNAVDRREKFRYFVEELLVQIGNEKLIDQLTHKFSELTRKAIVDCPMVVGAKTFLDKFADQAPLFLVSATPQKELDEILKERGLENFFKRIYGAPIQKMEVLKKIIANEKVSPNEMLYIGDSPEDCKAAKKAGVHFVARRSDRGLNDGVSHVFSDFTGIKNYILSLNGFYQSAI